MPPGHSLQAMSMLKVVGIRQSMSPSDRIASLGGVSCRMVNTLPCEIEKVDAISSMEIRGSWATRFSTRSTKSPEVTSAVDVQTWDTDPMMETRCPVLYSA